MRDLKQLEAAAWAAVDTGEGAHCPEPGALLGRVEAGGPWPELIARADHSAASSATTRRTGRRAGGLQRMISGMTGTSGVGGGAGTSTTKR
jgi:hypothetical protein